MPIYQSSPILKSWVSQKNIPSYCVFLSGKDLPVAYLEKEADAKHFANMIRGSVKKRDESQSLSPTHFHKNGYYNVSEVVFGHLWGVGFALKGYAKQYAQYRHDIAIQSRIWSIKNGYSFLMNNPDPQYQPLNT